MKCKYCDGTGTSNWCVNGTFINCPHCGGTGEAEMTNEEWFCQKSTEEKAEFLVMIQMSVMHPVKRGAVDMEKFIEEVVDWLKQPHRDGES